MQVHAVGWQFYKSRRVCMSLCTEFMYYSYAIPTHVAYEYIKLLGNEYCRHAVLIL